MNEAKIRLSIEEATLIKNAAIILTKNEIINKVYQLLGALSSLQRLASDKTLIPTEAKVLAPKIARGENYKGLPWLMLDYPRLFHKENTLAIRTMFWWGNYFSTTLLLSGVYKKMYEKTICQSYEMLNQKHFYICTNEHPWDHHFDDLNYVKTSQVDKKHFEQLVMEKSFLKLSAKTNLSDWDNATELLMRQYESILLMMQISNAPKSNY